MPPPWLLTSLGNLSKLRDKHTNLTECRDLDRLHPFLGLYPKLLSARK